MFAMLLEMQCKDTTKKTFFQAFSGGRITSQNKRKNDVTYGNIFHGKDAVFTHFFRTFVPIQKHIKTWKILTGYRLLPMAAWSWPRFISLISAGVLPGASSKTAWQNILSWIHCAPSAVERSSPSKSSPSSAIWASRQ
jgi:hypothetical protein